MDGTCLASRWKITEENFKWRNWRDETTSKVDGQCAGDNDETYAIKRNKPGYGKEQRKMERISFRNKKLKWLVKLKKMALYLPGLIVMSTCNKTNYKLLSINIFHNCLKYKRIVMKKAFSMAIKNVFFIRIISYFV